MEIFLHKHFLKKYPDLKPGEKTRFKERRELFLSDPFHPILNNHALSGKYKGLRSINIGGDLRAVYDAISDNAVLFVDIDTHSKLYE
ncbi:MAG: type II toxin-antitoxin system mRNA interferase toxin, RelE/StbE family [Candidatus Parcubacteria bacterium]|nr:type II toxin-antitoxin system mRNA interferase toxin, RelE/StbE family [Candidatus Parcubacteria bacterium]